MKRRALQRCALTIAVLTLTLGGSAVAQSTGPNVIVGDLPNVANYGSVGDIAAFSVGTTSCNIGDTNLLWISGTNQHPVIGGHMYKIHDGRLTQIGLSWLKHGFFALSGSLCDPCNPTSGTELGVGCSDPYGASLNGSQGGLGSRMEVNATTGFFIYPPSTGINVNSVSKRLQVHHSDLDPVLNDGAKYFVEGHYVTPDDAAAGNATDNASYREVLVTPSGSSYNISLTGSTVRGLSAIHAWAAEDDHVALANLDIPGDGRIEIGMRAISLTGTNTYRIEYAVHNMNSDRSVRAVEFNTPSSATFSSAQFFDVDYHSGEPVFANDWTDSSTANSISFTTDSFNTEAAANAIRWGTTYSFSFVSDVIPTSVDVEIFKPGGQAVFNVPLTAAACPLGLNFNVPGTSGSYTLDSNAAYNWIDISGTGAGGPGSDDGNTTANLGFTFPFYDQNLTDITINSNGHLYISGQTSSYYSNNLVPGGGTPVGQISPFWDDLNPGVNGNIYYQTLGSPPNRQFVVTWDDLAHYGGSAATTETFQAILDEDGTITFNWAQVDTSGSSASVGIEGPDGAEGVFGSFNAATVSNQTSWEFTRTAGTIPASADLTVYGDGSPSSMVHLVTTCVPNAPVIMYADATPGPTVFATFGTAHIGFTPAHFVIADGIFGGPSSDPGATTNDCGQYTFSANVPPSGLPSGFSIYFWSAVWDPSTAPNGFAHMGNAAALIIP